MESYCDCYGDDFFIPAPPVGKEVRYIPVTALEEVLDLLDRARDYVAVSVVGVGRSWTRRDADKLLSDIDERLAKR